MKKYRIHPELITKRSSINYLVIELLVFHLLLILKTDKAIKPKGLP